MNSKYSNRSIGEYKKRGAHCYGVQILNEEGKEHDNIVVNVPSGLEPIEAVEAATGLKVAKKEKPKAKD